MTGYYILRYSDGSESRFERSLVASNDVEAITAITAVVSSYQDLTNCVVAEYGIVYTVSENGTYPSDAFVNDDKGIAMLALTGGGHFELELLAVQSSITSGLSLEPPHADLIDHINALANAAFEGETIDTTTNNGVSGSIVIPA